MINFTLARSVLLVGLLIPLGCGSECVLTEGKCPKGCDDVEARPLVEEGPSAPCFGGDELLACREKTGRELGKDSCAVAPDGTVYFAGATSTGVLIAEEGYAECTQEHWDRKASATGFCE